MNIIVSIDGSKHSSKAIDYLIKNSSMFEGKGSNLIVLHVQPDIIPPEVTQYVPKNQSMIGMQIRVRLQSKQQLQN